MFLKRHRAIFFDEGYPVVLKTASVYVSISMSGCFYAWLPLSVNIVQRQIINIIYIFCLIS